MKKKKKWLALAGGVAAYITGVGLFASSQIMYMKKKEIDFVLDREVQAGRYDPETFKNIPQEEKWIQSKHGYRLHTLFAEPNPGSKKWMIFVHGITENKYNSIRFLRLFTKRGFNAVIYDHRRHGQSEGKTSSYGFYEKDDLQSVIQQLKADKGDDILIGIHGESMGAATLLLYGGMKPKGADFYIADCPFSEFSEQVAHLIKRNYHLPKWMILPFGDWWLKRRDGYSLKEVSPLKAVENIDEPVLFIHTLEDTFIPPTMSEELYEHKKGPKQLVLLEKGAHAQAFNTNPEEYEKAIDSFLDTYVPRA
ncbi:hypothetical protein AC622_07390 [Bacillus sp. FJAT-27916]|uniref:alpha/beta hydrolase n=1 Tax=Bacillaceae TaxID=186817 RepID=UPI00067137EA|nr:alpha/beta hydrolase [Bacillus sp. FJAT-27916]KMY44098.1 hypothetical protein AC622_07390 [Bacillus sp. FJAT-27916]